MYNILTTLLTAGGVLSPRVDSSISRLTGTDICLNGPAQEILTSTSRHAHIKHAVVEIWCRVHMIMAEAEGAIGCLNYLTLSSSRLFIGTPLARGTTPTTAGVVSCHLPSCPKLIWIGDYCSRRGEEVIIWFSIKVSTQSACFISDDSDLRKKLKKKKKKSQLIRWQVSTIHRYTDTQITDTLIREQDKCIKESNN